MRETDYAYAVARIHANENRLLTRHDTETLLACETAEDCLRTLSDRGYNTELPTEEMLSAELAKAWALVREVAPEPDIFNVLLCKNDYHNLKAAIKGVVTGSDCYRLFVAQGLIDPALLQTAAEARDFSALPEEMRAPANEAMTALLETQDGQLADVILDRAALSALLAAGKASGSPFLAGYAEMIAATADIRIAIRAAHTGKSIAFLRRALAPCGSFSVTELADAAVQGMQAVIDFLAGTAFSGATEALSQSLSAFEKWCDDRVIESLAGAKTKPFGVEPLAAYLLGKENEVKTVRIILSDKHNSLPDDVVRSRVRLLY